MSLKNSTESKLGVGTGFESLGVPSKQHDLGATETKTDRVFQKQLSYLKKHGGEIQAFLTSVAKGTDELEGSKETVQKAQAIAKRALPLLENLDTANQQAVNDVLELCLEAHITCIEDESTTGQAKFVSPSFMKRVEKLDRLVRNRTMSVFTALNVMATSIILPLEKPSMESTNSGTANPSYFVRGESSGAKQMLFKPRAGEKQVFPNVEKGGGFRRQVAAYLIDRGNGGAADIPLSIAAEENDQGMGSIQTFRKNRGDLTKISNNESKKIPLAHFQHVALHRLRFYDLDGHLGNFLQKESNGEIKLIPIDFDYSLPRIVDASDARNVHLKLGIRFFPHMDKPLETEVKQQLLSIDIEKDAQILSTLGFGEEEIKLFKHTTTMLQEMAKRDFTLGQMLDELDSDTFRFQVFQTSDEEDLQEVCKARVEEVSKSSEELNARILEIRQKLAEGGSEAADAAAYSIRIFFEDHQSHRAVLVIMKDLLEKFPDAPETTKAIEYLKGMSRSNTALMHDVFREIVQQMRALSLEDKAVALEKWMLGEFY